MKTLEEQNWEHIICEIRAKNGLKKEQSKKLIDIYYIYNQIKKDEILIDPNGRSILAL